jgi:hypothetical protein
LRLLATAAAMKIVPDRMDMKVHSATVRANFWFFPVIRILSPQAASGFAGLTSPDRPIPFSLDLTGNFL